MRSQSLGNHRRAHEAWLQGDRRGKASEPVFVVIHPGAAASVFARHAAAIFRLTSLADAADTPMELWYWHHSYLTSEDAVDKSRKLVDKAAAAGYNGLALWDRDSTPWAKTLGL